MVDMSWDRPPELEGVEGATGAPPLPITGMKRPHDSPGGDLRAENGIDLHNEVKRLRREIEEKDRRLEELERIVTTIQQAIPQQSLAGPELQDLSQPAHQSAAAPPV